MGWRRDAWEAFFASSPAPSLGILRYGVEPTFPVPAPAPAPHAPPPPPTDAPDSWVELGGVCGVVCSVCSAPTETEPCPQHQPREHAAMTPPEEPTVATTADDLAVEAAKHLLHAETTADPEEASALALIAIAYALLALRTTAGDKPSTPQGKP